MKSEVNDLTDKHTGTLHYEVESDNGNLEVIEDKGYYIPKLPCIYFQYSILL